MLHLNLGHISCHARNSAGLMALKDYDSQNSQTYILIICYNSIKALPENVSFRQDIFRCFDTVSPICANKNLQN